MSSLDTEAVAAVYVEPSVLTYAVISGARDGALASLLTTLTYALVAQTSLSAVEASTAGTSRFTVSSELTLVPLTARSRRSSLSAETFNVTA